MDMVEEFVSFLNLIHRLSVRENAGQTQNMIQCIVDHVRYKYLGQGEIVKLETEMAQVDNLIRIFRARYGENLIYQKVLSDGLPGPYLPSNTLLALVENELVYGLVPKEGDWRLSIDLDKAEEGLLIRITDNGLGLAASAAAPPDGASERRNGIAAVNARLKDFLLSQNPCPPAEPGFAGREPVAVSCSGKQNRIHILLPCSDC